MLQNKVDAEVKESAKKEILDAINLIDKKLPFLVALTPDDRREMPKMGNKTHSFVNKALEVASQNEEILPRYFKVDDLKKDMELVNALSSVSLALSQLSQKVDDTIMTAGSEAYIAALVVYRSLQNMPSGTGLDGALEELKKHFKKSTSPNTETQPTEQPNS